MSSTPDPGQTPERRGDGTFDTTQWEHGGYEADAWDSGPDYVPLKRDPADRRRRSLIAAAIVVVVGLIAALATYGAWTMFSGHTVSMRPGNCITLTPQGTNRWTSDPVDCADTSVASYVIVTKLAEGQTCAEPYTRFEHLVSEADRTPRSTYCLMENLVRDSCYGVDDSQRLRTTACTDPSRKLRVVDRLDEVADAQRCPTSTTAVVFDQTPRRTYCLELTR